MAVVAGQKIGPYEVRGQIGAGGIGEVYRVRDRRLRRDVAIKVLPASFSSDSDRLQRFAQEARAAAALNHPNILAIFDIGEDKTAPYVVSELLEGETLRDRLRSGALSTRRVLITEDVGQAGIVALPPGENSEKNLSWFDWSIALDLSPDGGNVIFSESGEATRGQVRHLHAQNRRVPCSSSGRWRGQRPSLTRREVGWPPRTWVHRHRLSFSPPAQVSHVA